MEIRGTVVISVITRQNGKIISKHIKNLFMGCGTVGTSVINAGSHSVYIFVDCSKRIGHYTIKALLKKCDIVVISVEMYGIVVISVQLANLKDEPTRQGNKISVSMKVLIMVSNKLHPSMTHQKALTYINIA